MCKPLFLRLIFLVCGILPALSVHAASDPKVATANWTIVETLLAIGVTPYAVADKPNYDIWVVEPKIPAASIDLGLRNQPNLELLAENPPDVLLTSTLFSGDNQRLARLTNVYNMDNFASNLPYYEATQAMTLELGRLTHHEAQAQALITQTDQALEQAKTRFKDIKRPIFLVQFSDAQHVRVFGEGNMIGTIFARTPLNNAWKGPFNDWGFASISIDQLAQEPEAHIVILKPLPRSIEQDLSKNEIWQHLPAVQQGRVSMIDSVWLYAGFYSLQRLINLLAQTLDADNGSSSVHE